jgi:hypothetical protein
VGGRSFLYAMVRMAVSMQLHQNSSHFRRPLLPRTLTDASSPRATNLILIATVALTAAAVVDMLRRVPLTPGEAGTYLALFIALFLLRVIGQIAVVLSAPAWLPPMSEENWNLVPYRVLLPSQLAILALMFFILHGVCREYGPFGTRRPVLGIFLISAGAIYAHVMAARYVVRMIRKPDARWFGGAIPIVFHMVLAAFLLTWGLYHRA